MKKFFLFSVEYFCNFGKSKFEINLTNFIPISFIIIPASAVNVYIKVHMNQHLRNEFRCYNNTVLSPPFGELIRIAAFVDISRDCLHFYIINSYVQFGREKTMASRKTWTRSAVLPNWQIKLRRKKLQLTNLTFDFRDVFCKQQLVYTNSNDECNSCSTLNPI